MKSFLSLILEQEEPEPFKFDDIKYKKKGVDQAKDVVGPAKYSAAAQKQKGTSNIDDVLQRNLAKADKQFDDILDRAGIKPEEIHQGIDPHSGQLETTRAAKAEAKTTTRQVAKEMRSAAKLTPKDIDMIKKLENRPGMQRSLGMLGRDDLDSAVRQAHFDKWGDKSHRNPTRVSAAGRPQGTSIRSGSFEVTPKPAPRTPPLFDPEAVHGGTVRSGSLEAQSRHNKQAKAAIEALGAATKEVKGPDLGTKLSRAGTAALRSPLGRVAQRALPVLAVADAAFRIKRGYEAVTDPDLSAREKSIAVGRELPGGEAAFIRADHEKERIKQAMERSKRTGRPYVQPREFGPRI
jgi:hypothetical protein